MRNETSFIATSFMDLPAEEEEQLDQKSDTVDEDGAEMTQTALAYEKALEQAGHGSMQFLLLIACGCANVANAIVVTYISYVVPSLGEPGGLHFTSNGLGVLTAIAFAGLLVGDIFWGSMADATSRKRVTIISLTTGIVFCFLTAVAPTEQWMIAFRFFLGVGVGGSMAIIFAYLGEFLTKPRRAPWIAALSLAWLVGGLVAAGIAWLTIPAKTYTVAGSEVASWRVYTVICAIVAFVFSIPIWMIPKSPKLLLEHGEVEQAERLLSLVQRVNTLGLFRSLCSKQGFYENSIDLDVHCAPKKDSSTSQHGKLAHAFTTLKLMTEQFRELFKHPFLKRSILINTVSFTFTFGFYGLTTWMPEYFKLIQQHSNCSAHENDNCTNTTGILENIYFQSFISRIGTIPAQLFAIWIIKVIGSKRLLVISLFLSSGFVFAFALMSTKVYGPLLMSCLFGSVSSGAWSAIDVLSVELFPTLLRSSAIGMQEGVGRIGALVGNLAFGALAESHLLIPLFISAILIIIGALCSLALPRDSAQSPAKSYHIL